MSQLKVPISKNDHILGNTESKISLVEYGDFQCPYCRVADLEVKQVIQELGDHFYFVFRHFPLSEIHPYALSAAEASEFASDHGLFWEMHDIIYTNQDQLVTFGNEFLYQCADSLQLSVAELKKALSEKQYYDKVHNEFLGGVKSGVNGTPTFYLNGIRYNGSYKKIDLIAAINEIHN